MEKYSENFSLLKENTKDTFLDKTIHAVCDDCFTEIIDLGNYVRDPKNIIILAYINPRGMKVKCRLFDNLRDLPIYMWILVPTGLGVYRLLKKSGEISYAWLNQLEKFWGLSREKIRERFYSGGSTLPI